MRVYSFCSRSLTSGVGRCDIVRGLQVPGGGAAHLLQVDLRSAAAEDGGIKVVDGVVAVKEVGGAGAHKAGDDVGRGRAGAAAGEGDLVLADLAELTKIFG